MALDTTIGGTSADSYGTLADYTLTASIRSLECNNTNIKRFRGLAW